MNHAITIGGLLLGIGALIGFVAACFGLFMMLAGGMSDAPAAGESASRSGCVVLIIGALVLAFCVVRLFA